MPSQNNLKSNLFGTLLENYRPKPGVPDELLDATGSIRPAWTDLLNYLAHCSPEERARNFGRGDQYLRDAGVFYRQYNKDGATERDWPLSHVPVLIDEREWHDIERGLIQRADLLEAVVADIYGDNKLVTNGHIPAALVARNPEWLRPLVGIRPQSDFFLHFIAFEIGRGPDGKWWVLGDRTQAPSGAGFALETRVATRRIYSELFPQLNIHRLAGFFRAFRDALSHLCDDSSSRVAILTPGAFNETYFEHAYIARYLGFMLLEGEDLAVQDGRVMVRTVAGPQPINVLWRRIDAAWMDPLELNETSRLGTPGIVGAIRQRNVTMINALGAGILETRALLAFLPRICEAMRGEPLVLPNIATWWCGQPAERSYVMANLDRMVVSPALTTQSPFSAEEPTVINGAFQGDLSESAESWLGKEGSNLVGQEAVTISTSPAYVDGQLVPRPMSLRVFLARTPQGWRVMPGGFARIGQSDSAIALRSGGSVADVWIASNRPVEPVTMIPQPATFLRRQPGTLPSRTADNLFWLGRYVERAEGIIRLLRAYHVRLAESANSSDPLLEYLYNYLHELDADPADRIPDGLLTALESARRSAAQIRERFSVDGWAALIDLIDTARDLSISMLPGDEKARAMGVLLRKVSAFSGLVHENMYRFTGWRFLSVGRSLERSIATANLLSAFADPNAPHGALDLAVEVGDSVISHRRRYSVTTVRDSVVDLLVLDEMNPRAIAYQIADARNQVDLMPGASVNGQMSPLPRAILRLHTSLLVSTPEQIDTPKLKTLGQDIAEISNLLSAAYFS